jgi:hypothetical protein
MQTAQHWQHDSIRINVAMLNMAINLQTLLGQLICNSAAGHGVLSYTALVQLQLGDWC